MEPALAAPEASDASTRLADYDFELPAESIAQEPAPRRDAARLLVLERATGLRRHSIVTALPEYLRPGDLIVANDTRVIPARVRARIAGGAAVELLLLHAVDAADPALPETPAHCADAGASVWRCLGKPGKRLRKGARLDVFEGMDAEVVGVSTGGQLDVRFPVADVISRLDAYGEIPLPPYIRRATGPTAADDERYQTMFARRPGSVAAPTAGLHFTPPLLAALEAAGVSLATVTLHVGPGTFMPVRADDARDHQMLPERYLLPQETVEAILRTKRGGGRIVAIGTTTTRALESAALRGELEAHEGWANLFLHPGVEFRVIDALLTNFHLPRSTLLLLVSALAGREAVLAAYTEAIALGYRFYSYGDAMLIL